MCIPSGALAGPWCRPVQASQYLLQSMAPLLQVTCAAIAAAAVPQPQGQPRLPWRPIRQIMATPSCSPPAMSALTLPLLVDEPHAEPPCLGGTPADRTAIFKPSARCSSLQTQARNKMRLFSSFRPWRPGMSDNRLWCR